MEEIRLTSLDKHLRTLRKFFERWKGGTARIWAYSISHKGLTIVVERQEKQGNLCIDSGGTEFINGATEWSNCNFEIEVEYDIPGKEKRYILRDREANFELWAGLIEVAENRKFKR